MTPKTVVRGGYGHELRPLPPRRRRQPAAHQRPAGDQRGGRRSANPTAADVPHHPAGLPGRPDRTRARSIRWSPTSPTCRGTTSRARCRAGSSRCSANSGTGVLLDVAYVGNRGRTTCCCSPTTTRRRPTTPPARSRSQARRPDPGIWRHHLRLQRRQVAPTRRCRRKFETGASNSGLTLLSSLTLSEAQGQRRRLAREPNGNFPAPQDFNNLDADYGLSAYHQPYNSTTSFVWDLPFGRGRTVHERRQRASSTRCSAAGRSRHQHRDSGRAGDAHLHARARPSRCRASSRTSAAPTTTGPTSSATCWCPRASARSRTT